MLIQKQCWKHILLNYEAKPKQLPWGWCNLAGQFEESVNSPQKYIGLLTAEIPPSLPPFSSPHNVLNAHRVWGEKRNSVPLKCCLLKTVYRILVINSLSQDSYFWSGLWGGNLLESNSFILRFTVLPFPAERGEKWNHMFWGASVGNPTEDKWLLLSPGN